MKIGFFDSGLGGLLVMQAVVDKLPSYDYVYLGDTANMPYGNKTKEEIILYVSNAIDKLVALSCSLIIIACNTASAEALRVLQRKYGSVKILGVVIPTIESLVRDKRVGLLATKYTVESDVYKREMEKHGFDVDLASSYSTELATLIDAGSIAEAEAVCAGYIDGLIKQKVEQVVLGCTHYILLKNFLRKRYPDIIFISQDEILPQSLQRYLSRHGEIEALLSKEGGRSYYVTKLPDTFSSVVNKLFTNKINLWKI